MGLKFVDKHKKGKAVISIRMPTGTSCKKKETDRKFSISHPQ